MGLVGRGWSGGSAGWVRDFRRPVGRWFGVAKAGLLGHAGRVGFLGGSPAGSLQACRRRVGWLPTPVSLVGRAGPHPRPRTILVVAVTLVAERRETLPVSRYPSSATLSLTTTFSAAKLPVPRVEREPEHAPRRVFQMVLLPHASQPLCPQSPPLLRWAGSKRQHVHRLLASLPRRFETYVEPFLGSGCLFFALAPKVAVLGDINSQLIDTYKTLKWASTRLCDPISRTLDTKAYYRLRAQDDKDLAPFDRAVRFILLNRHCFNGVYRVNSHGRFNVPFGAKTRSAPTREHVSACARALRRASLQSSDFAQTLESVGRDDFAYIDPPYVTGRGERKFGEYGLSAFGDRDVSRLLQALKAIDARGGKFLLSYTDALPQTPSRWRVSHITVRRHVGGFVRRRNLVTEILVTNYDVADRNTL
jgi:DNA adenine methylase